MKCSACGYDDLGTGDSAHVCQAPPDIPPVAVSPAGPVDLEAWTPGGTHLDTSRDQRLAPPNRTMKKEESMNPLTSRADDRAGDDGKRVTLAASTTYRPNVPDLISMIVDRDTPPDNGDDVVDWDIKGNPITRGQVRAMSEAKLAAEKRSKS